MTNQTKLNNLKTIHQLHTSGDVLSFLREVRESMSFVDEFSNKMHDKINKSKLGVEDKKQEKPVEKVAEAKLEKTAEPAVAEKPV